MRCSFSGMATDRRRLLLALAALLAGCRRAPPAAPVAAAPADVPAIPGGMRDGLLPNPFAYIPAACWTRTRDDAGQVVNTCYACHVPADAPNFVGDDDLQRARDLPPAAADNPWKNLLAPPPAAPETDAEILAYVRRDNYFDDAGEIALARALEPLPAAWDGEGDRRWDGYRPDAYFRFDDRGFDRRPDGSPTGWRAYAFTPVVGSFPTNGAMSDALIRLAAPYREDARGEPDLAVYAVNLAITEALIKRADVALDATADERALGVDLDRDGRLGTARRVAFDGRPGGITGMRWVGRAGSELAAGRAPIAVGLFPIGTELLHSLRYFDVRPNGTVTMAARMKELRYARKARWLGWADLRAEALREAAERRESRRARTVLWEGDRGVSNGQGWLLQGFIEAADGRLRPQSHEESVTCAGCHGGIGATADCTFSFARKLGPPHRAGGWFHGLPHDPAGTPEPRRRDGSYEYTLYLSKARGGDPLRANDEVRRTFFDARGQLDPAPVARLHGDVATLLLPSAARALDLDRATRAIVRAQSFRAGREPVLGPARQLHARAPDDSRTGVDIALLGP
jgi:hypothetical protein